MADAARKLQQAQQRKQGVDAARVESLMSAMLELGAARDGVWDEVSVAALRAVASEMAKRAASAKQVRKRLRGIESLADARVCVNVMAPSDSDDVPASLQEVLRRASLTVSQQRYLAALYASDPLLRAAIDEVVGG